MTSIALSPVKYKSGGRDLSSKKNVIAAINQMINNLDFVEVWRDFHPNNKQFTWSSADGKIKCRLDYWLIFRDVLPFAQSSEIIVIPHGDHAAVTLSFYTQKQHPRGPGFWKFNGSLRKYFELRSPHSHHFALDLRQAPRVFCIESLSSSFTILLYSSRV